MRMFLLILAGSIAVLAAQLAYNQHKSGNLYTAEGNTYAFTPGKPETDDYSYDTGGGDRR